LANNCNFIGCQVDYQLGSLVVRKENVTKVHLSEISTLIIESTAVSLTAALLNELVKRKIKVVFCDERRNPSSELIPYYGCHDSSLKIRNQIKWGSVIKEDVWTMIVYKKSGNRCCFLENFTKIFVQLKAYLSEYEIQEVYTTANYCKANLLFIENRYSRTNNQEKVIIMDKDLCIIPI